MQIVDRKEHVLRSKVIPLVKVLWKNHEREAATWEPEVQMRRQYPQLFSDLGIFLSFEFSCSFRGRNVLKEGGFVTPRPDEVHSTYNCKGAYVH